MICYLLQIQTPSGNLDDTLKVVSVLIWPVVTIVVALFLAIFFKKAINSWLAKVFKVKFLGAELKISPESAQQENSLSKMSDVDRAVAVFTSELINDYRERITKESEYEKALPVEKKIDTLLNFAAVVYLKLEFEQIYHSIWGSQIQLLLHLNSLRGIGDSYNNLQTYFDGAVERYPNFFSNYSYKEYFEFFTYIGFVTKLGENYNITLKGTDFVKYIAQVGKSYTKNY